MSAMGRTPPADHFRKTAGSDVGFRARRQCPLPARIRTPRGQVRFWGSPADRTGGRGWKAVVSVASGACLFTATSVQRRAAKSRHARPAVPGNEHPTVRDRSTRAKRDGNSKRVAAVFALGHRVHPASYGSAERYERSGAPARMLMVFLGIITMKTQGASCGRSITKVISLS